MNLLRVWAVTRKEFIHIKRDPRSLGMAIAIPMLMIILFGSALSLDVDRVPVVVWDQSLTPTSREFIASFGGSRYFSIVDAVENYRAVERAIDTGEALMALVVPTDFARLLEAGRPARVQLIVDGSDSNTATLALGYADAIALIFNQKILIEQARKIRGMRITFPLDVRPRAWFNPSMESKNYIIPGLIAVIMMVIAALLTSLTVAREWEQGTMEQLISTPVRGPELILGKMVPYFIIGMVDVLLAVLMGQFVFHVPLRGNVALLFGMAAIFLAGALSMGMLISILTKSQLLSNQLAVVTTFLPAFLLSGFVYSISNMPVVIRVISRIVPARYFIVMIKGIYLKGVGLEIFWMEALLLTLFGALMVLIATVKFKKKLA